MCDIVVWKELDCGVRAHVYSLALLAEGHGSPCDSTGLFNLGRLWQSDGGRDNRPASAWLLSLFPSFQSAQLIW